MYTLPTGHPRHSRVSSGISAGAEVIQPTSAPGPGPARKTKAKPKPVVVEDKDIVELDLEGDTDFHEDYVDKE